MRWSRDPHDWQEQWYEIFDTLFPGHSPRPVSPYNNYKFSEQPLRPSEVSPSRLRLHETQDIPREYITGAGAEVLQQAVIEDPVFSHLSESDIRSALDRGLSRLLDTYSAHRLPQRPPIHMSQAIPQPTLDRYNGATLQALNTPVAMFHTSQPLHRDSCGNPVHHGMPGHECPRDWTYQALNQGSQNSLPIDDLFGGQQPSHAGQAGQVGQPGLELLAAVDEGLQASDWEAGSPDIRWASGAFSGDDWLYIDYEHSLE